MLRCSALYIYKTSLVIGLFLSSNFTSALGQNFVYLEAKNDFLNYRGHGSDKYFTAGVTSGGLINLKQNKSHYFTIALTQDMYTSSNIVLAPEALQPADYPYAGLTYFSIGYQIFNQKHTTFTKGEFSWGTTGPSSGAKMIQSKIHKIIGDREPIGWSTQLQLGNFIQSQFEYTHSILKSTFLKINVAGNIHLGSIFNNLTLASEIKLDKSNDPFIGHFTKLVHLNEKPQFSLWARPKIAYVLSNRLLQTNQNHFGIHQRILHKMVYYNSVGFTLQFKKFSISLIQHNNSPEFKTATKHAFGEIAIQLNI